MDHFRHLLTQLGVLTARPVAFVIFLLYVLAWLFFGRDFWNWHAMATIATWGMTLLIQRAEHRDTQAIHAKLDELLKVHGQAQDSLMEVDDQDAEEVEDAREQVRRGRQRRRPSRFNSNIRQ